MSFELWAMSSEQGTRSLGGWHKFGITGEFRSVPSGDANARDYHQLRVFQLADELVLRIYQLTKSFPRDEMFGLTSQIRRAAVSVPGNIVEGSGRESEKDFRRHISIA